MLNWVKMLEHWRLLKCVELSWDFIKENQKHEPKKTANLNKESKSKKKRILVHFYSFACKLLISWDILLSGSAFYPKGSDTVDYIGQGHNPKGWFRRQSPVCHRYWAEHCQTGQQKRKPPLEFHANCNGWNFLLTRVMASPKTRKITINLALEIPGHCWLAEISNYPFNVFVQVYSIYPC